MSDTILGKMTCPNCGCERGTDIIRCICGYNPLTGKVENHFELKHGIITDFNLQNEQNENWNKLSYDAKTRIKKEYNIVKTNTPVDGFPLFESINLLEEKYGKHNLKDIKTWNDIDDEYIKIETQHFDNKLIRQAVALLQIKKLIELGYGGNVSSKDLIETSKRKAFIYHDYKTKRYCVEIADSININAIIVFYSKEYADEFLTYGENLELLNDYFIV